MIKVFVINLSGIWHEYFHSNKNSGMICSIDVTLNSLLILKKKNLEKL